VAGVVALACLGTLGGSGAASAGARPATLGHLSRANATTWFKRLLAEKYGATWSRAGVRWAKCPRQEFFPHGASGDGSAEAYCMAEFRSGHVWRYVAASVQQGLVAPVLAREPFTRRWTRRWRRSPARCLDQLRVPGRAYSNDGACEALMISDLAFGLRTGHHARRAYWHGTNTAGFGKLAAHRCRWRARSVTCRNALGDAFRWRF
jgi:hypothetical protein